MPSTTYADAGVDIKAGDNAVELIKEAVSSTHCLNVLAGVGAFGAVFELWPDGPVLVSSIDGVGTKLKVATMAGRFNTVGQCLVNHCVNDILTQGARAMFMLDYFASSTLIPDQMAEVVIGMAEACKAHGCALIGGETAEMPGVYCSGEFDLVATVVGLVESREKLISMDRVRPGNILIGLESNGLHTNGFSLARRVLFDQLGMKIDDRLPWGRTVAEELLRIHRSYSNVVLPLCDTGLVNGIAHITGGGLLGNVPRILPPGCEAHLHSVTWPEQPIFEFLRQHNPISEVEFRGTFNDGIGLVLAVDGGKSQEVLGILNAGGQPAWGIGTVMEGTGGVVIS